MRKPKIGLLALYIKLYDDTEPEARPNMDAFYGTVAEALEQKGLEVVTTSVCRIHEEFERAVRFFEESHVDLLVTLHLAYSPSLESADVLCRAKLPILVLDTTGAYDFGPLQESRMTMFNHGIHGVQDLCNLLVRAGRSFGIEAGHWQHSDVLDRVSAWAKAAAVLSAMKGSRIGMVGEAFEGMGDFAIAPMLLREKLGVETVVFDPKQMTALAQSVTDAEIEAEKTADAKYCVFKALSDGVYRDELISGLAVRKWMREERLDGLTINFLAADQASGLKTMPFMEMGKVMARGLGYAGEGDVLTAALSAALNASFAEVSFTEMFSPDWKGGSVLVSHMGEMNLALTAGKPIMTEMPFIYTDAGMAVKPCGRFKAGEVCLVNLSPISEERFRLIVAPGKMLDVIGEDRFEMRVHGWFKPDVGIERFLTEFSRLGGIHHSVLVYGNELEAIRRLGELAGWDTHVILEA